LETKEERGRLVVVSSTASSIRNNS